LTALVLESFHSAPVPSSGENQEEGLFEKGGRVKGIEIKMTSYNIIKLAAYYFKMAAYYYKMAAYYYKMTYVTITICFPGQ
jgi:hypothetical protein